MRLKIILLLFLILTFLNGLVSASIVPSSYYSRVNSDNMVYETTLYVSVSDTYCADNPSVWSVSEPVSEIQVKCYTIIDSLSYWKVVIKYQNPISSDSVTLYYNHGGVRDSFTFNPKQFYKYDLIKQVGLDGGKSVFIGEPSLVRSIETIDSDTGTGFQTILLQTIGFDNTSQYTLELYNGTTLVNTFSGKPFKLKNLDLMIFMSTVKLNDDVYTLRILEDGNPIGDFLAYVGSYSINFYGSGLYVYKKAIIKGDTFYIRVRNSNSVPVALEMVRVKVITNDLQVMIDSNTTVTVSLNPGEEYEVPITTITSSQLDRLTHSFNIMTTEVYYTINGVEKYKKITTSLTRKDVSYSTNVYGYVQLGQVNLIYPRQLTTMTNDNFDNGVTSIQNAPVVFMFVEYYAGHILHVNSVSLDLHPVHGGSVGIDSVDRIETVYTTSGLPVGVYRVKVNYNNIHTGLIPVVGNVTINAYYYWWWFKIPVTIKYPIEFTINTNNVQQAQSFVNSLSTPIYSQLDTLKFKFKTYDYFWIAYSRDADAGYTGHFFDYYNTAGDSFPVTDITQNPKVLVTYTNDAVSILFDSALKDYFNYDDLFTVVMNEKGVLKEPLTYTMQDVTVGSSTATEVVISLRSSPFVTSAYDYYFIQAYQTNGFLILKHQVYKTIIPFTMFRLFSVYYDESGLTILNKGASSLVYYPDAGDTSTYYLIQSNSYQANLPIGSQPLIVYNGEYYYLNSNYSFNPRLLNENIYLPLRTEIDPNILLSFTVSDTESKKLYDLALLQLFPTQYKSFLLKSDTFYTYTLVNNSITSITYNSNTVSVSLLKEYYLYSFKVQEYRLDEQLYDETTQLTLDDIKNSQAIIHYADSSTRTTHLVLFDVLKRDFLTNIEKTPTLFKSSVKTVISYYDPRLAPGDYEFNLIINSAPVQLQMELKSPNHVVLYYGGELSDDAMIAINGKELILVVPS